MILNPKQRSFKQAMISIVFTNIWLEARLHLVSVDTNRDKGFKNKLWNCSVTKRGP